MKSIFFTIAFLATSLVCQAEKKHLFILSGQSNMVLIKPDVSFTPMVEKEFGKANVVVVKDAAGGKPIGCWSKSYVYPEGFITRQGMAKEFGELYDRLMKKVKEAAGDETFDTVTFCWMQGESDARDVLVDLYEQAFLDILSQLKADLGKEEINFVIGRLSDHGLEKNEHWVRLREIQVKIANDHANGQWINTDDCNDGPVMNRRGNVTKELKNDLHMSPDGYKKMGERFAEKAIALIKVTAE